VLQVFDLGCTDYVPCLELQKSFLAARREAILLTEHKPVITFGVRKDKNLLRRDEAAAGGIQIVHTARGGGATAHNQGQITMYAIIDLRRHGLDITSFVRLLEETGIRMLADMGVVAGRKEGLPGLWVGEKKIASLGVKVSSGMTYHGIAINLCNDLSIFAGIVPCGLDSVEMINATKLGAQVDMVAAGKSIAKHFALLLNTDYHYEQKTISQLAQNFDFNI
jgi:lipoate-protein ligase B